MSGKDSDRILCVEGLDKSFSGNRVLKGVSFELRKGEVHALLGENGAGKSTLIKILTGIHKKDAGSIRIYGREVEINRPADAGRFGIGTVYQEFSQVGKMSVRDNLFLGRELRKKRLFGLFNTLDRKEMERITKEWLQRFHLDVKPGQKIHDLGVAHQQIIEIIKSLMSKAEILIMDEPTAALSKEETQRLFDVIAELKKGGASIIYISHLLEEVKQICDRATIIRDGQNVGTKDVKSATVREIVEMMIGKKLIDIYPERSACIGETVLQVKSLGLKDKFDGISFVVRAGEILGITGLTGAGKTELLTSLFGLTKNLSGEVILNGKKIKLRRPGDAKKNGIALIPEDRKKHGLILKLAALQNVSLPNLASYLNKFRKLNRSTERKQVLAQMLETNVKPPDLNKAAGQFSGGNQQKIVIAKWIASKAKLLLIDEPTRGVDIGAREEIYRLLRDVANQGCAVIVASSDPQEIIGLSDRIIVMNKGRVSGEFVEAMPTVNDLLIAQIGGTKHGQ